MKQILVLIFIMTAATLTIAGQTKDKRDEKTVEEIKKLDRQWQVESYWKS